MDDEKNLAAALEAIMAARRDELGDPPRPDELLAYRDGTLTEPERIAVEEKIAAFPDAARALLDLADFPDVPPAPGVRRVSAEEVAADWPALRRRMAAERRRSSPPARRSTFSAPAAATLAAGLVLGGGVGLLIGRGPLAPQAQPSAEAEVIMLAADDGPTRSEAGSLRRHRPTLLVLDTGGEAPLPAYAVTLRGAGAEVVWRDGSVEPTPEGALTVLLPAGSLAAGSYRIEIAAREDGEPLLSFDLAVADDGEPLP